MTKDEYKTLRDKWIAEYQMETETISFNSFGHRLWVPIKPKIKK